jgi:hypothetical protein
MRYKATSPFARPGTPPRPSERARRSPKPPAGPRDRFREWAATLPILLILAIVFVGDPARAAVPTLTYAGEAMPGMSIVVSGTGYAAGADYQLRWDGNPRSLPRIRAAGDGSLSTQLVVPVDAAIGPHTVDVVDGKFGAGRTARLTPLAIVTVAVIEHEHPAPATPTLAPTTAPTIAPTAAPTTRPASTPQPTHAHPTATAIPTVRPSTTSSPTASATPSASPHEHGGSTDRVACTGYPERRVFLESQGWWVQTPGSTGTDFGHVHVGMCFPLGQQVRGVVTLDVRLTMHDNPGRLGRLDGGIRTRDGGYSLWSVPIGLTCPTGTCVVWTQLKVDTSQVPTDGRAEWRFRPRVRTPDGKAFDPSTGWQAYLANGGGRPVEHYRDRDSAIARGWYEDSGYVNAGISAVPTAPVSGTWTPSVNLDTGSEGPPVTFHGVYVDPDFHRGSKGIVIREGQGPYGGTVAIDTARLSPGPHRLVLRSDARDPSGSTSSGVLVVHFTVAR